MSSAQTSPAYTQTEAGKTLGIIALVAVFFVSLLGLILGLVAQSQSRAAGVEKNTPARVAVILGIVFLVLQVVGGIVGMLFVLPYAGVQVF